MKIFLIILTTLIAFTCSSIVLSSGNRNNCSAFWWNKCRHFCHNRGLKLCSCKSDENLRIVRRGVTRVGVTSNIVRTHGFNDGFVSTGDNLIIDNKQNSQNQIPDGKKAIFLQTETEPEGIRVGQDQSTIKIRQDGNTIVKTHRKKHRNVAVVRRDNHDRDVIVKTHRKKHRNVAVIRDDIDRDVIVRRRHPDVAVVRAGRSDLDRFCTCAPHGSIC